MGQQEEQTPTPSTVAAGQQEEQTPTPSTVAAGQQEEQTPTPSAVAAGQQEEQTPTPSTAAAGQEEAANVSAKVAAGDAAIEKLDLEGGIAAYRSALEADPDSFEANWKLARALTDKATLSTDPKEQKALCVEAEKLARKAIELDPKNSEGHTYLAVAVGKLALFEGGKRKVELSKEVKAEAEKALQLNPDDDVALHVLAIWNREMVQLGWFLKTFAQMLYGKFPPASLDTAITDLRRASELKPDAIPHHVELGITLAAAKQWAEAKTELDKGLALPIAGVTDDYYQGLARAELKKVEAHLK
jgi:tetratricopeptide (TPR) repeat protein